MRQILLCSCQSPEFCCQGSMSAWLTPVGASGTSAHLPGWSQGLQHVSSHENQGLRGGDCSAWLAQCLQPHTLRIWVS